MNEEALLITESMLLYYTERAAQQNHPHADKIKWQLFCNKLKRYWNISGKHKEHKWGHT
jgi:hypothetical protein